MKVGDKVGITDYSSASMIKDGKIVQSCGWPINRTPQTAIVIATGCVLPFGENYPNTHWSKNDTIIHIPEDGRVLFIRASQLRKLDRYCSCCGQKVQS
jgi:hypothetical protein